MQYDFDKVINRYNTNSIKFDFPKEFGKPEGVVPMWVADMDFQVPEKVTENLGEILKQGIYGYTGVKEGYFTAVKNWFLKRHGYEINEEWLVKTPGVVFAVAMAVRAFTKENDSVLVQTPVYYPFFDVVRKNNRKLIDNTLKLVDGKYKIDFKDFEQKIIENNVKLFILCSPHNPVGRVWTKEELTKIGEICLKHKCLVIADEIHCDFVYKNNKHVIFPSINKEIEDNSILCTAPSKTFNLAGLQVSNIFIKNKELREKFIEEISKTGYLYLNIMGLSAAENSYKYGEEWLDKLIVYLQENIDIVKKFLEKELPQVKLIEPEGTYLLWLDFKDSGIDSNNVNDLIAKNANLWFSEGKVFGEAGKGFQRVNIACPKETLKKALNSLKKCFEKK